MRPETEVGLKTRLKAPLMMALLAGTLCAGPALAQSEFYEAADERKDRGEYRTTRVELDDDDDWERDDPDDWFDDDEEYVEFRTDEWEFDDDPEVVIYEQYYTVEYERDPDDRGRSDSRIRPGPDETVAQDTDYYYDPEPDEPRPRSRERARVHRTETYQTDAPVRTQAQMEQQRRSAIGQGKASGELMSYRQIHLQGQPEPHTVVKLRTPDNRIALVNLGPRASLREMGLQQGDSVVAEGRQGTINNQPVLIATSIRSEGAARQLQTSNVDDEMWLRQREGQAQQMQQRQERRDWMQSQDTPRRQYRTTQDRQTTGAMAAGTTRLRGEVQSHGTVELQGQSRPHTIMELRLEDGQRALVNLGPNVDARDLNLRRGDTVMVEGKRGRINRQPVLMATSIEVNGQRTQIRQPQAMGVQQQQRGPMQQQGQVRTYEQDQIRTSQQNQQDQQYTQVQQDRVAGDMQEGEELREQDESGHLYTTERVAQSGQAGEGQQVRQLVISWPTASKEAALEMESKYGEPDVKTSELLIWKDSGPFTKTIVHKEAVQHNFPTPHEDVLEQCVKYQVPADKMDDLAEFDGSIVVNRTEGTMSARCHKEDMNILALNLADQIIKGDLSVDEARQQLAETARAYEQGDRAPITQELQFQAQGDTAEPDSPAEEEQMEPSFTPAGNS